MESPIWTTRPRPCGSAPGRSGSIHYERSPRRVSAADAAAIGAAFKRKCEVVGVFVNPELDDVVKAVENAGLTMVQLNGEEGPNFCREVARRTGLQGDQGGPRLQRRRHPRRRGVPHRPPSLRSARRTASGAGPARASTGACCTIVARRSRRSSPAACGLRTSPRRSRSRIPTRSTSPAASRPSRAARTTPRWPPSSRPPKRLALRCHEHGRRPLWALRAAATCPRR